MNIGTITLLETIAEDVATILAGYYPQADIAAKLIKISQAAQAAIEAEAGQPEDEGKVQPIEPLPDPNEAYPPPPAPSLPPAVETLEPRSTPQADAGFLE